MAGTEMGDLKRCAECQEFYFRYLVMFRSPSPCKSKNPKPTFNAGYFRFTANCRGLFHPLPTNTPPPPPGYPIRPSHHRLRLGLPLNSQPLWINETGGSALQITVKPKCSDLVPTMFQKYTPS